MEGVDIAKPVCEKGQYTRPAFVPWYDDKWSESMADTPEESMVGASQAVPPLPPLYGGLWSTMAYLIHRKAMEAILTKLDALPRPGGTGKRRLGTLSLPLLADHLLFQSVQTYTCASAARYPLASATARHTGRLG